jgi:steroid 5-alpha reductase family enzyme
MIIFAMQYYQRAFVYGYLMSPKSVTTIPVVLSAIGFNLVNGFLQCGGITQFDPPGSSFQGPRFWIGIFIWAAGSISNIHCDHLLRSLRKPGESGYKIPYGGMFKYVSAANYFCESVMWFGWAIACSNNSGWLFLFMTISNLFPRALSQHKFYLETFKEYKGLNRKAYLPLII